MGKQTSETLTKKAKLEVNPMTNEQELRELFQKWASSLPKCVGYAGSCDGDLVGLEHESHCPMFGKDFASGRDCFEAGFRAGVEKERERCLALLESEAGAARKLKSAAIAEGMKVVAVGKQVIIDICSSVAAAIRSGQDGGKG